MHVKPGTVISVQECSKIRKQVAAPPVFLFLSYRFYACQAEILDSGGLIFPPRRSVAFVDYTPMVARPVFSGQPYRH